MFKPYWNPMLLMNGRSICTASAIACAIALHFCGVAEAQCPNPQAELTVPTNVEPYSRYDVSAMVQDCNCTLEASTNEGATWNLINGFGPPGGVDHEVSGGCESVVQYRLRCVPISRLGCDPQPPFTKGPKQVQWRTYEPELKLTVDNASPEPYGAPFTLTGFLSNPTDLNPFIPASLQASSNGGVWHSISEAPVNGGERDIATISPGGCASTISYRLHYEACGREFNSSPVTVSWSDYVPQVRLVVQGTPENYEPYQLYGFLANPAPMLSSVSVQLARSTNGGTFVYESALVSVGASPTLLRTYSAGGCQATVDHRATYTACNSLTVQSSIATVSWADYVPIMRISTEGDGVQPYGSYRVVGSLENPHTLLPFVVADLQFLVSGATSWATSYSIGISATPVTVVTGTAGGCAGSIDYRLRYRGTGAGCSSVDVYSTSGANVSWPDYMPQVTLFPQSAPNGKYDLMARLDNAPPQNPALSVSVISESLSNTTGQWTPAGTFSVSSVARSIGSFSTSGCGESRSHRARYTGCNGNRVAGATSIPLDNSGLQLSIHAPSMVAEGETYSVEYSMTGIASAKLERLINGQLSGTQTVQGSGMANYVGTCGGQVTHRLSYEDYCGLPQHKDAETCCSTGLPPFTSHPNNATAHEGGTVSMSVTISGATSYEWRHNGAMLSDGLTEDGSTITGASTSAMRIDDVVREDSGEYTCVARNSCGSQASNAAVVVIIPTGDLDGDGSVSITDLSIMLAHFGLPGSAADGDLDGDGDVDLNDLAILLANFGQ